MRLINKKLYNPIKYQKKNLKKIYCNWWKVYQAWQKIKKKPKK